jgi:hypothetical protein
VLAYGYLASPFVGLALTRMRRRSHEDRAADPATPDSRAL